MPDWRKKLSENWSADAVREALESFARFELQPKRWQSDLKVSYYLEEAARPPSWPAGGESTGGTAWRPATRATTGACSSRASGVWWWPTHSRSGRSCTGLTCITRGGAAPRVLWKAWITGWETTSLIDTAFEEARGVLRRNMTEYGFSAAA